MKVFINIFGILGAISLLTGGCSIHPLQSGQDEPAVSKEAVYETVLGKSVTDTVVVDFLAGNACVGADRFQLCKDAGIALLVGSNQTVEAVYLYLNKVDGFAPYQGELPYGLKYYDIMGAVEHKLRKRGIGNGGLPDEGGTPDHLHYWATYHQAGMTIIYNSPSAEDEDATIYAILVGR
jgi:hypothetical protein